MTKIIGRLALAALGVLVLAAPAAAQDYDPAYAEGQGYDYGYEAGSRSASSEIRTYESDRYGARYDARGGGYEEGYGYEYDSRDGYEQVRHEPQPCDWRRPADPRDPYACPPGYGVISLPGSFFYGGGGVGPEYIAGGGGGGGGYAYAGASAGAGAYAYASASASARVSFGGRKGGHHPGKKRGGGCGCR